MRLKGTVGAVVFLLKPGWRKIVLTLILGIIYFYFWSFLDLIFACEDCMNMYGFPLPFSYTFTYMFTEEYSGFYSLLFLIVDVFIWYLVSCETILVYNIGMGRFKLEESEQTS